MFTIALRQKPEEVTRMLSICLGTPYGYCKRKPFNLEKMTSNVLSVLLINLWDSSRSWNSSPIEMDIVYVNERNFYERTKFLWTMVLFKEKPNDALQTWIVQRNDKRMFSKSFFKIQKKTKRVQINFFFVFQPIFLALK